jgi:hypothetical protein
MEATQMNPNLTKCWRQKNRRVRALKYLIHDGESQLLNSYLIDNKEPTFLLGTVKNGVRSYRVIGATGRLMTCQSYDLLNESVFKSYTSGFDLVWPSGYFRVSIQPLLS